MAGVGVGGGTSTHVVTLRTSFMLVSGSELSGQRRRQGAKMMARALGDMRFTSSSKATLHDERQLGVATEPPNPGPEPQGGEGAVIPWSWDGQRGIATGEPGSPPDPPAQAQVLGPNPRHAGPGLLMGTPRHPGEQAAGTCFTRWKMSRSSELWLASGRCSRTA